MCSRPDKCSTCHTKPPSHDTHLYAWAQLEKYKPKDRVAIDGIAYTCRKSHISSCDNMPGSGCNWEKFWRAHLS